MIPQCVQGMKYMKKSLLIILLVCNLLFTLSLGGSSNCKQLYNRRALDLIHYKINHSNKLPNLYNVKVAIIDEGIDNSPLIHLTKLRKTHPNIKSHGSIITNLLGAQYDKTTGFKGLMPGVPIYGYSLSPEEMNTESLTVAINTVTDWDVDIINISMGTNKNNDELRNAILNAVHKGIVVTCSSGNNPDNANYPASFSIPGVISVGTIGNNYSIPTYTNSNPQVDIYAPGENIYSIIDNTTGVKEYSGTSLSVPFVTLACIYIKTISPTLSSADVEKVLVKQSDIYAVKWKNDQKSIRVLNMAKLIKSLKI